MKNETKYLVNVQIEFTCTDEQMARDQVMSIPFGDHDVGFAITGIQEGSLPPGTDEVLLPEYRTLHKLQQFNYASTENTIETHVPEYNNIANSNIDIESTDNSSADV